MPVPARAGTGGRTQTAIKNEDTGDYSTVYVNTSSHGTNMSVNTSIPIFTGLEIPHQYALAKLNLKAAIADLDKAKEDIAINIASAYLQVLFNEELHQVALGQVQLSKEQYVRISRLPTWEKPLRQNWQKPKHVWHKTR